jgi:hypothetical protein
MASAIAPSSPMKDPAPSTSNLKEFRCTWANCTKSFSRAEHLHRHALNHDEERANNTCLRCSAVFKRRDLLGIYLIRFFVTIVLLIGDQTDICFAIKRRTMRLEARA